MRKILLMLMFMLSLALILSVTVHAQSFDSCAYYRRQRDTAWHQLYLSNQKVNAAMFYIKCVQHKPANRKFFWNWITTRAMVSHPTMSTK